MIQQRQSIEPLLAPSKIMTPGRHQSNQTWEDHFDLLQHLQEEGWVNHEAKEFWLVTDSPRINAWLVYNKIQLKRGDRESDDLWQQRKERLQQLGFRF